MTNKDVLKILLCSYGFDRNIKVETNKVPEGLLEYYVYAENKDGYIYDEVNCESFMFNVCNILKFMKEYRFKPSPYWTRFSAKDICNDSIRNNYIKDMDKNESDHQKWLIYYKPIEEWHKINNPCINCQINKKDHEDSIHYNCEMHHNHTCQLMIDHYNKKTEMIKCIKIE